MTCPRCSATLPLPGDAHVCRAQRPSIGWEIANWALVTVAAGYGLLALAELVIVIAAYHALTSALASQQVANLTHLVSAAKTAEAVFWAILVGFLVALVVWRRMSAEVIRRHGDDDVRAMLRHWGFRAWSLTLLLSIILMIAGYQPNDGTIFTALGILRYVAIRYGLRAVAAAFLIVGVVMVRRRIRRLVADPTKPVFPAGTQPAATGWRRQLTKEEDLWGWDPDDSARRKPRPSTPPSTTD